jgi:RNA polymerase sigma-70 factor (ECF subfamily)
MTDNDSAELLARWQAGDQAAAAQIVERYTGRLLALARARLSEKLAQRVDPEDILQSAYRSFFAGALEADFVVRRSGELWHLLAAITLHKLQHQAARHAADRRSVYRETSFGRESSLLGVHADLATREPSPSEAAALIDELELVMRDLRPLYRRMVEMRLQGHRFGEIAVATERSERFVRRVLDQVKRQLKERYPQCAGW